MVVPCLAPAISGCVRDHDGAGPALQGVAEMLAAMTPCSRLYGYLGLELAAACPQANHAYKDWILTYSSPAYLALPEAKEALLDTLGKDCDFGEVLRAARHFPLKKT